MLENQSGQPLRQATTQSAHCISMVAMGAASRQTSKFILNTTPLHLFTPNQHNYDTIVQLVDYDHNQCSTDALVSIFSTGKLWLGSLICG